MSVLAIKRGDTFQATCTDSFGDLTGISVEAEIWTGLNSRRPLTVEMIDIASGIYTLHAGDDETVKWPLGAVKCDLQYSGAGIVAHSNTFEIFVSERVTR